MSEGIVQAAVKGLIVKDGKFLILRQKLKSGKIFWDLPGGRIKYGEDAAESLKREILEEINIDTEVGKPIAVWHFFWDDDKKVQVVCITFVCRPKTAKMAEINLKKNPDNEENIVDVNWFTPDEFLKNSGKAVLDAKLKKVILDYFQK